MEASADVISLARSLLTLARAGCTGILTISASGKQCRIALAHGRAHAASASAESTLLGDWLLRRGELDVVAHAAALGGDDPSTPVGTWLLAHGIASQAAIERALQDQLRARVLGAFRWHGLSHVFEPGPADIGMPWLDESVDVGQLALTAVRGVMDPLTLDGWLRAHAQTRVGLSAFGRTLLRTDTFSSLAPELNKVFLEEATVQQIVHACRGSDDALRSFGALYALSAIVPVTVDRNQYSILLRKRAQLRRRASAAELLEVGRDARAPDVRRALRRLAKHVHPDALGPLAPASLREASSELMRALLQAERELRPLRARVR